MFAYGSKYIDNYLVKCPHCNGIKKIYDADDGKGILKEYKLCHKKGYIDFLVSPFTTYERTKRI